MSLDFRFLAKNKVGLLSFLHYTHCQREMFQIVTNLFTPRALFSHIQCTFTLEEPNTNLIE